MGGMVMQWLTMALRSIKRFWVPTWWPIVWSLHVISMSVWVTSGHSGFLPLTKEVQIKSIDYPEFPLGANVNDCSSLP